MRRIVLNPAALFVVLYSRTARMIESFTIISPRLPPERPPKHIIQCMTMLPTLSDQPIFRLAFWENSRDNCTHA